MIIKEIQKDRTINKIIINILYKIQNGLCSVCGDDLDWDIKMKGVKSDIKNIYDLKLTCKGKCGA